METEMDDPRTTQALSMVMAAPATRSRPYCRVSWSGWPEALTSPSKSAGSSTVPTASSASRGMLSLRLGLSVKLMVGVGKETLSILLTMEKG